jgi:hypothetical protein
VVFEKVLYLKINSINNSSLTKMTIDLYFMNISPPCRAVLMTAKHLNIEFNEKQIDLLNGEHLSPQFVKVII